MCDCLLGRGLSRTRFARNHCGKSSRKERGTLQQARLRPYWRGYGIDATVLLKKAAAEYESLKQRCEKFDAELMGDLRKVGGEKYAQLCALAYRQTFAGNKICADANGQPLMFPKEK